MKWYVLSFLVIILLLFLPLPIKIKLSYCNNCLKFYIYKFELNFFKKKKKDEKKENIKRKKKTSKLKLNISDMLLIIKNINKIKFKPILKLNILLNYGLADAAATGISYGIISYFISSLFSFLAVPFKIKKYKSAINPDFNNFKLEAKIESIIFISLAKIMYMGFIIIKSFIQIKALHNKKQ